MPDEPKQVSQPTDQPSVASAEAPPYREITKDELDKILEEHQKWMETKRKVEKGAEVQWANLQGVNLEHAQL